MTTVHHLKGDHIVCGDFNNDFLGSHNSRFFNLLKSFDLNLQNHFATRVSINSGNCIDHIFSDNIFTCNTVRTDISDHYALLIRANNGTEKNCVAKILYRELNKLAESEKVFNYLFLLNHKIKKNMKQNNVDEQMKELTKIILDCIEKFVPLRILRINRKSQWMTNQVKNTIKKKNNSFKKWWENPSKENHKKYRQQRNLATKAIKNARLSCFDNLTKKKDKTNKNLFSAFSEFCTDKKSVELNINPEIFNDYFAGIGKNLVSSFNDTDICFGKENINNFAMSPVIEKEVSASIRSLKNKASSGHDGISNKIVKISISVISHPLKNFLINVLTLVTFLRNGNWRK